MRKKPKKTKPAPAQEPAMALPKVLATVPTMHGDAVIYRDGYDFEMAMPWETIWSSGTLKEAIAELKEAVAEWEAQEARDEAEFEKSRAE